MDILGLIALAKSKGKGGTSNYTNLTNKPSINSVILSGNKTSSDLGLADADDLNELDQEINGEQTLVSTLSGENLLSQGSLSNSGIDNESTIYFNTRLRTSSYYAVTAETTGTLSLTYASGLDPYFGVSFYTKNDYSTNRSSATSWIRYSQTQTFNIPAGTNYIRLTFKNGSAGSANMSRSDFTAMSITNGTHTYNLNFDDETSLQYGDLNDDGTINTGATLTRVINYDLIPIVEDLNIAVTAPSGFETKLFFYDENTDKIGESSGFSNITNVVTPTGTQYMRILVRSSESGIFSNGKITTVTIISGTYGIKERVEVLEGKTADGTVIGADCLARAVHTEELGALTYAQAFCKYGGKYYSTDGSHVGRQSDSFASETTVSLSVGHGNAMQLGSGSIAYVSGWDDQSIYAVDLSDLTISDTITLPTTGYTTGVVDDLNKIAYIFQRDSSPNTEAHYNFIVYDITNEQVISTKVVNSFAAMQAADFYNGKIAVLWGLGTNVAPSGMAIYNTAGDILCRYDLDIFKSAEPEGVFMERDGGGILISLYTSKKVYRITDIHN